jgi:predicted ribosome quality control (RQC) complex YloA/Tae2 family protein
MKVIDFIFNSNTYTAIIGKNKTDNFKIIDDATDNDIWFHVQGEPSCHVILKNSTELKNIPRQVIKQCAYMCKINSKAKTKKNSVIIYTPLCNVIKTEIVGQVAVSKYKSVNV